MRGDEIPDVHLAHLDPIVPTKNSEGRKLEEEKLFQKHWRASKKAGHSSTVAQLEKWRRNHRLAIAVVKVKGGDLLHFGVKRKLNLSPHREHIHVHDVFNRIVDKAKEEIEFAFLFKHEREFSASEEAGDMNLSKWEKRARHTGIAEFNHLNDAWIEEEYCDPRFIFFNQRSHAEKLCAWKGNLKSIHDLKGVQPPPPSPYYIDITTKILFESLAVLVDEEIKHLSQREAEDDDQVGVTILRSGCDDDRSFLVMVRVPEGPTLHLVDGDQVSFCFDRKLRWAYAWSGWVVDERLPMMNEGDIMCLIRPPTFREKDLSDTEEQEIVSTRPRSFVDVPNIDDFDTLRRLCMDGPINLACLRHKRDSRMTKRQLTALDISNPVSTTRSDPDKLIARGIEWVYLGIDMVNVHYFKFEDIN